MSKYKNNPNYFLDPVSKRWKKKNNAAEEYAKQVMSDAGMSDMEVEYFSPQVTGGGGVPDSMVTGDGTLETPDVSIISNEEGLHKTFDISGENFVKDRLVIINEKGSWGGDMDKEIGGVTINTLNIGGSCSVFDLYGEGDVVLRDSIVESCNVRKSGDLAMSNSEAKLVDIVGPDHPSGGVSLNGNTVAHDVLISYGDETTINFQGDNRHNYNMKGAVGARHNISESDINAGSASTISVSKAKEFHQSTLNVGDESTFFLMNSNSNNSEFNVGNNSSVYIKGIYFNDCEFSLPDGSLMIIHGGKNIDEGVVIKDVGYENFGNGDGIMELVDVDNNVWTIPFETNDETPMRHNLD